MEQSLYVEVEMFSYLVFQSTTLKNVHLDSYEQSLETMIVF